MANRSFEQAVQVLKERVGARWEAGAEDQGELAHILSSELQIARGDANKLVDDLIESGHLRYHRSVPADDVGVVPGGLAIGGAAAPIGGTNGGTIGIPAVPAALSPGYWQIGGAESEQGATPIARTGQVEPR